MQCGARALRRGAQTADGRVLRCASSVQRHPLCATKCTPTQLRLFVFGVFRVMICRRRRKRARGGRRAAAAAFCGSLLSGQVSARAVHLHACASHARNERRQQRVIQLLEARSGRANAPSECSAPGIATCGLHTRTATAAAAGNSRSSVAATSCATASTSCRGGPCTTPRTLLPRAEPQATSVRAHGRNVDVKMPPAVLPRSARAPRTRRLLRSLSCPAGRRLLPRRAGRR